MQCCSIVTFYIAWQIKLFLNVCFQEEIPMISRSELTDLKLIGGGGFGDVYRAQHAQLGTVVYKELDAKKLSERYSEAVIVQLQYLAASLVYFSKLWHDLIT